MRIEIEFEKLIDVFCEECGVSKEEVFGRGRGKELWTAREMLWTYLHTHMKVPVSRIASMFGRAPTNIFRGIRVFKSECRFHKKTREKYLSAVEKFEGAD